MVLNTVRLNKLVFLCVKVQMKHFPYFIFSWFSKKIISFAIFVYLGVTHWETKSFYSIF